MADTTDRMPDVAPHLPGLERYIAARDAAIARVLGPVAKAEPAPDHMAALLEWGRAFDAFQESGDAAPLARYVARHGTGSNRDAGILAGAVLSERKPKASGRKRESNEIRILFLNAIRWHMAELGLTFTAACEACAGEFRGRTYDRAYILRARGGMFCRDRDEILFKEFQKLRNKV